MALTDNILAYYKFDESSGNPVDTIGSYNLTNNGSTGYSTAKINNGIDFGTSNSSKYLSATLFDPDSYNSGLSFAFWIKFNTTPAADNDVFSFTDAGWGGCFARFRSSNVVDFRFGNGVSSDGGTTSYTGSSGVFNAGNWLHIAMVHNATSNTYYINGVQVAQRTTGTITLANNGTGFNIGRNIAGVNYTNAVMDEFGIWSRALTADEVSELYNSGAGLQYPFKTTYTTTASVKSRIKQFGLSKTIQSKARVSKLDTLKTIQSKSRIETTNTASISSKAMINQGGTQIVTAKSRIKQFGTSRTIHSKGRIEQENIENEITAKGRIIKTINNTVQAKGRVQKENLKTIQSKSNICQEGVEQSVSTKATIEISDRIKTIQGKSRIFNSGVTKTLTAKAKIWAFRSGYVKMNRGSYPKTLQDNRKI